jgi:hypothetical protein
MSNALKVSRTWGLALVVLLIACTSSKRLGSGADDGSLADDSNPTSGDSGTSGNDSAASDDSSVPDDSSTTSGDIEWTLLDSTDGPVTHDWAVCFPDNDVPCKDPEACCGVSAGIVTSQMELAALYDESLPGIHYVPEVDFSSYAVVWSYLACCATLGPWLVVDDVTRVGLTLELTMHVETLKLAPSAFGRPWVVVQVPSGDYEGPSYELDEKGS